MHSNKEHKDGETILDAARNLRDLANEWRDNQMKTASAISSEDKFEVTIELTDNNFSTPSKGSKDAVGYDLYSTEDHAIKPLEWKLIGTGIRLFMPKGLEAQIRSKSGLASKGVFVLNSPGTIDPDYKGEIKVILANLSPMPFDIDRGDKIAQLVYNAYEEPKLNATITSHRERGEEGFGSSDEDVAKDDDALADVPIGGRW
jgi:dUTP pyrophosphatase